VTAFATKLSSATFNTALKGIRIRNRHKLVAEYVLGGTQAESVKNRANPALPLTVQGTPTYNANSVTVRSSATAGFGFKTGIILNDDATLIVVRKNAAIAAQPMIVGCRDSNGAMVGMAEFGATNYAHNGESANTSGANRSKPGAGVIYFEALVQSVKNPQLGTGGFGKLYYYSGGVQQVATSATLNAGDRRLKPQLCIGSNSLLDSITNNSCEVFFVAILQRTAGASEIEDIYGDTVADYARRGVTVV
jgi:hypothetical protein